MNKIKIRYVYKDNENPNTISMRIVDIEALESGLGSDLCAYKIISRDLFTSRRDDAGLELYEHDIVRIYNKDGKEPAVLEVRYDDAFMCFGFLGIAGIGKGFVSYDRLWSGGKIEKIESIGNKWENPELLKSAKSF